MTVTEFLEARIAEDEAAARGALDGIFDDGVWTTAEDWGGGSRRVHGKGIIIYDEGGHDEEQAAHIARWDPARVLAECAAKRAIIRRHAIITVWPDGTGGAKYYFNSKQVCASCDERTQTPCPTIGLLAAVYSDHPDYDKDWAL